MVLIDVKTRPEFEEKYPSNLPTFRGYSELGSSDYETLRRKGIEKLQSGVLPEDFDRRNEGVQELGDCTYYAAYDALKQNGRISKDKSNRLLDIMHSFSAFIGNAGHMTNQRLYALWNEVPTNGTDAGIVLGVLPYKYKSRNDRIAAATLARDILATTTINREGIPTTNIIENPKELLLEEAREWAEETGIILTPEREKQAIEDPAKFMKFMLNATQRLMGNEGTVDMRRIGQFMRFKLHGRAHAAREAQHQAKQGGAKFPGYDAIKKAFKPHERVMAAGIFDNLQWMFRKHSASK